jgi:hypothetical protein
VGPSIANCRLPIADWPMTINQSTIQSWQSAIEEPTRYREVVLTS